jgi:hypothetical protein
MREKIRQLRPAFTAASVFLEFARLSANCCWLICKKARSSAALVWYVAAAAGDAQAKLLHFVMIKPSHYDDGYPIQWVRSAIPFHRKSVAGWRAPRFHRT